MCLFTHAEFSWTPFAQLIERRIICQTKKTSFAAHTHTHTQTKARKLTLAVAQLGDMFSALFCVVSQWYGGHPFPVPESTAAVLSWPWLIEYAISVLLRIIWFDLIRCTDFPLQTIFKPSQMLEVTDSSRQSPQSSAKNFRVIISIVIVEI